MSDAVLCNDLHLDRLVVIKALKSGVDQRRLLDELAALQAIRSKHVVQVYDVIHNSAGAVVAIVEEFLPGSDLTAASIPTNTDEFLRLVYPIAEGIADVHAHGRVHRDIKPENMKYDAEGCLKIFDFGLARDLNADANTVNLIGTRGYMAPELFQRGSDGKVSFTPAIDVYAFGATVFLLTTGGLPEELLQIPPRIPPIEADFGRLAMGLPLEISNLLNRCFDPNPILRPAMIEIARLSGLYLLRDKHRALLVSGGNTYILDRNTRVVRLSVANKGSTQGDL
jgi:serine/threonine-protein kinase